MRLQCRIAVHALVNFYFIDSGGFADESSELFTQEEKCYIETPAGLQNQKRSTWNKRLCRSKTMVPAFSIIMFHVEHFWLCRSTQLCKNPKLVGFFR